MARSIPKQNDDEEIGKKDHRDPQEKVVHRLDHFTWPWFTCSMSTASLAVVLSQQAYTFPGLDAIGKILYILSIVLWVIFTVAISYRFARNPYKIYRSLHRPREALFFGSFWVTIALILEGMQAYGVPSCGPWLVKTLEIIFWTYAGCAMVVSISQYSTLFMKEHVPMSSIMPTWIFPVYPFLVIGPLAAVMIPSQPPQAAYEIFIGGVLFQGLGWCVSIFMYTVYMFRLMSSELPSPSTRPGMFVSVGPAGYTSAALVSLGSRAPQVIPAHSFGIEGVDVGAILNVIGLLAGIFVWLLSFWFFALTMVTLLTGVRQMRFTLNWWAMIFPNAGLTLATIQIGNALDSNVIKAITSAMTIILVLVWLFVAVNHIAAVATKKILWRGQDEDVDTDQ